MAGAENNYDFSDHLFFFLFLVHYIGCEDPRARLFVFFHASRAVKSNQCDGIECSIHEHLFECVLLRPASNSSCPTKMHEETSSTPQQDARVLSTSFVSWKNLYLLASRTCQ